MEEECLVQKVAGESGQVSHDEVTGSTALELSKLIKAKNACDGGGSRRFVFIAAAVADRSRHELPWSARERTLIRAMESYVKESEQFLVGISELEPFLLSVGDEASSILPFCRECVFCGNPETT